MHAKLKKNWEKTLSLQLIYDLLRQSDKETQKVKGKNVKYKKEKRYEEVFNRNRNGADAQLEC